MCTLARHVFRYACGSSRITCGDHFSLSTLWYLGIELKFPDVAAMLLLAKPVIPPPPLLFWDGPGICYAFNNYFGLLIFLSLPPECCDHMCAPGAHLCDLETLICDFLHGRKAAHELTCKPKPLVRNFESVSFSFMGHMGWLINIFGSVGLLGIRVQDPVFPYLACRHANVPCILGNPCVSEPHLLLPH